MASTRTWWKGARAAFRASVAVPAGGDLVTTSDGVAAIGDGVTALGLLATLAGEWELPFETGYLRAETDTAGRIIRLVDVTGGSSFSKLIHAVNSVPRTALTSDVVSLLPSDLALEAGYLWAIVDTAGRVLLGILFDGTVVGKFSVTVGPGSITETQLSTSVLAKLNAGGTGTGVVTGAADFAYITGVTPNRKATVQWAAPFTGPSVAVVSSAGDDVTSVRTPAARRGVLYTTAAGVEKYVPPFGGTVRPAVALPNIVVSGDSLAKAHDLIQAGILDVLAAAYPAMTVANEAVSTSQSSDASFRAGGTSIYLQIPGGTIPATGAEVPVTFVSHSIGTLSFSGSGATRQWFTPNLVVAGLPEFDLGHDGTGWYARLKDGAAGTAITVTAGATYEARTCHRAWRASDPALPSGLQFSDYTRFVATGRNNFAGSGGWTPGDVAPDTAAILATQTTYATRNIVGAIFAGTDDPVGSSKRTQIDAANTARAVLYGGTAAGKYGGGTYWDHHAYIRDFGIAELTAAGYYAGAFARTAAQITQDNLDIAHGCIPTSMHIGSANFAASDNGGNGTTDLDTLHLVDPAYRILMGRNLARLMATAGLPSGSLAGMGWY